jgi:thioesterase domain-containing protein
VAVEIVEVDAGGDPPPGIDERALVGFHLGGGRTPLVLVRTWHDEVARHQRLARALGPEQPLLSVSATAESDLDLPRTTEVWADRCRALIDCALAGRVPTHRPISVGGWSFGGVVARQVAATLLEEGAPPAALVLLDSSVPRPHIRGRVDITYRLTQRLLRELERLPPGTERRRALREVSSDVLGEALTRRARQQVQHRFPAFARRRWPSPGHTPHPPLQRAISIAYLKFQPRALELGHTVLTTAASRYAAGGDLSLGWARYAPARLVATEIPGDHQSMFDDEHVGSLAAAVRDALAD